MSTSICFSPTKIARFRRCGRCLSHAVNFKAMLGANRKEKLNRREKSRDRSQENRTSKKIRKFFWRSVFKGLGFWVEKFGAKNTFRYLLLTKYLIMIIAYTFRFEKVFGLPSSRAGDKLIELVIFFRDFKINPLWRVNKLISLNGSWQTVIKAI